MGASETKTRILKGLLFEIAILQMLLDNGFSQIPLDNSDRAIMSRKNFIELKGRGGWHQIDCPCDWQYCSPFMYPIRLLGEVKFTKKKVDKAVVRQYIGVLKDIQENYFVENPELVLERNVKRVLEIGCIFSAYGFNRQAESLAYAHGIKTISYENNVVVDRIKRYIEKLVQENVVPGNDARDKKLLRKSINSYLARNHMIDCVAQSECNGQMGCIEADIRNILSGDYEDNLHGFLDSVNAVEGSFIATTPEGLLLHFVGEQKFPEDMFEHTDNAKYRIHIEKSEANSEGSYYLVIITEKTESGKFYFAPPEVLKEAIEENWIKVLDIKQEFLYKLVLHKKIKGLQRTLVLELDNEWVLQKRREYSR